MTILSLGLGLFFGLHLYSAFRSRNPSMNIKNKLGEAKYMGLFSLGSLLGLIAIVWGYALAAPSAHLFNGLENGSALPPWMMAGSILLLCASQLPLGFIKKVTKHPMLIAVILWSLAHLLNGADLRQSALFGSFLIFSVLDMLAVSLRTNPVDAEPPTPHWRNDILAILMAVFLYALLVLWVHAWLFGISL